MIVVDASVAASWFFNDEVSDFALNAMERVLDEGAAVPSIFPLELGNALFTLDMRLAAAAQAEQVNS